MMGRLVKGKGRVVPKVVVSADETARQILAAARTESELRLSEVEMVEEDVRRRGHAEGYAAGREAGIASATEILARARADAEEIRNASRDVAVAIGRRMAEKIVGRALDLHPALIAEIAANALAASRARSGAVVLRVHPEDLAVVEGERPRLVARLAPAVDLRLVPDEAVTRGGCVVETPAGRLDAQLGAQLDALERALSTRER